MDLFARYARIVLWFIYVAVALSLSLSFHFHLLTLRRREVSTLAVSIRSWPNKRNNRRVINTWCKSHLNTANTHIHTSVHNRVAQILQHSNTLADWLSCTDRERTNLMFLKKNGTILSGRSQFLVYPFEFVVHKYARTIHPYHTNTNTQTHAHGERETDRHTCAHTHIHTRTCAYTVASLSWATATTECKSICGNVSSRQPHDNWFGAQINQPSCCVLN